MSLHSYLADDCSLPVPPGFRDRTTHVLEWKTPEGDSVVLVLHREMIPEDPLPGDPQPFDLDRFVADQVKEYPSKFAGYREERDEVASADAGFRMRRKAFRWKSENDVLYHHQVFVLTGDRVIVLTAAAKAKHRAAVDEVLSTALADFRARGE
jgi:hypothetical protein